MNFALLDKKAIVDHPSVVECLICSSKQEDGSYKGTGYVDNKPCDCLARLAFSRSLRQYEKAEAEYIGLRWSQKAVEFRADFEIQIRRLGFMALLHAVRSNSLDRRAHKAELTAVGHRLIVVGMFPVGVYFNDIVKKVRIPK